jgi:transcriptional regulator with XRE-family HTH domain
MHKKGGTELGTLYEKIIALCKAKGVSGSRMCLDLGLSKSTMSDMKNGRTKGISIPTAQKIAGYFGITVDELYGEEVKKEQPIEIDGLSDDLKELIEKLKELPEDKIQMLLQVAKSIK